MVLCWVGIACVHRCAGGREALIADLLTTLVLVWIKGIDLLKQSVQRMVGTRIFMLLVTNQSMRLDSCSGM